MKKIAIVMTIGLAAVGSLVLQGHSQQPDDLDIFMRAKLTHSQKLLEGLTTADFDMLAKHSQELALLSQATNWNVLQTEDYLQHSIEFRRAANAVTEAAKQKNLDGATLAFVDMTMKCVRCHKYVRGVGMAGTDDGARFDALSLSRAGGER
jgi:cytochrome c556